MKKLATCLAFLATLSVSGVALAEPTVAPADPVAAPARAGRGVITLPPVEISSRYMRPQASIAISRIDTQLTLVELKQLFVQRIEESLLKGAF